MEPLFRLALMRPAVAQDPANPSIRIAQDSSFQKALAEASRVERPREALQRVARCYTRSNVSRLPMRLSVSYSAHTAKELRKHARIR